jgi:hypothetical protein
MVLITEGMAQAGHGRILLDIAANPGQVGCWPDNPSRRSLHANVASRFGLRSDRP